MLSTKQDGELVSTSTLQETLINGEIEDLGKEVAALRGDIRKRAAETAVALQSVLDRVAGLQSEFLFNIEQIRSEHRLHETLPSLDDRFHQLEARLGERIDEERTAREVDMSTLKLLFEDADKRLSPRQDSTASRTEVINLQSKVTSQVSQMSFELMDSLSKERAAREADIAQAHLLVDKTKKSFSEFVESKFSQLRDSVAEERAARGADINNIKQLIENASEKVLPEIEQKLTQVKQLSMVENFDRGSQNSNIQLCMQELRDVKDRVASLEHETEDANKAQGNLALRVKTIEHSVGDVQGKLDEVKSLNGSLQESIDICLKELEMKFLLERKKACETQNNQFELCLKELEMKVSEERSIREANYLKLQDLVEREQKIRETGQIQVEEQKIRETEQKIRETEPKIRTLMSMVAKETSDRERQMVSLKEKTSQIESGYLECKDWYGKLDHSIVSLWKAMDTHKHDFSTAFRTQEDDITSSQSTSLNVIAPTHVSPTHVSPRLTTRDASQKVVSTQVSRRRVSTASPTSPPTSPSTVGSRSHGYMAPLRYTPRLQGSEVSVMFPGVTPRRMSSTQESLQQLEATSHSLVPAVLSASSHSPYQRSPRLSELSPRETLRQSSSQKSFFMVKGKVTETMERFSSGVAQYSRTVPELDSSQSIT